MRPETLAAEAALWDPYLLAGAGLALLAILAGVLICRSDDPTDRDEEDLDGPPGDA